MALRMWVPAGQRAHDTDAHHVRRPGVLVDAHARRRVPARQTAQVDSRDGAGAWDCFSSVICRHPSKPGTLRALRVRRLRQNTHRAARDGRPLGPTARSRDVRLVDGSRLGRHAPRAPRAPRRILPPTRRFARRGPPPVAFRSRRRARGPGSASATLPPRRRAPPLSRLFRTTTPPTPPPAPRPRPTPTPPRPSRPPPTPIPSPSRPGAASSDGGVPTPPNPPPWRRRSARTASPVSQPTASSTPSITPSRSPPRGRFDRCPTRPRRARRSAPPGKSWRSCGPDRR